MSKFLDTLCTWKHYLKSKEVKTFHFLEFINVEKGFSLDFKKCFQQHKVNFFLLYKSFHILYTSFHL